MSFAPRVSVLIPCHNAERFLEATLQSALRQTLPPAQILVVDDHSTDRSRSIVKGAAGVTLLNNPGRGASAARNHAQAMASGTFFQFLDADDLLEPHAIESRVRALEASGADVAVSDWQRLIERDGRWEPARVESGRMSDDGPADLVAFRTFWAPPAAILYRRSICERIGGWRETLPVIQDARFLFDAARLKGRFTHVPGVGALYRQHTRGSLSTRHTSGFWRDVLTNTREVEQLWMASHEMDSAHRSAVAAAYGHCAHVGVSQDRSLFEAGCAELRRFPEHRPSRRVRAAAWLTPLGGFGVAKALASAFTPGEPS